jgi:acetyltransferase-like isoleucine patch superfamily enzyme
MIMTYGGDIEIGRNCTVGPYAILYGHGGLRIGNYVMLAAHSVVIPADHTFEFLDTVIVNQPLVKKGITIEDDVWVGAGVKILDGVKVGCGAVIGAGSVVTRELIPFSVNVGVPSRIIKMRR